MAEGYNMSDDRLLRALAEQLKLPLLQIARQAELLQSSAASHQLQSIQLSADMGLRLIEGYLLGAHQAAQSFAELSPVSLSSVLNDAAHTLDPLAKQYGCDLELSLGGKYAPVMAHPKALETALLLLGQSMIEAHHSEDGKGRIVLAAHRHHKGLSTGVFADRLGITTDMLRRGRALYGAARQALPSLTDSNGAAVFVADSLFKSMETTLRSSRHKSLNGLAATLHVSRQMQLV